MKVITHDLNQEDFLSLGINGDGTEVVNADVYCAPCAGCFHHETRIKTSARLILYGNQNQEFTF
jgi:hypothetical protein